MLAGKYLIDQRMKVRQPKPTRPAVLQRGQSLADE
ncbi:MAG: hypothetical protein GPOALKHO_000573 [Sodalis sp.]|nr:MAG: hypothetical protein GPOALKHO_000573 [Sodalis sp.]